MARRKKGRNRNRSGGWSRRKDGRLDVYVTVDTHEGPRYVRTTKKTEEQAKAWIEEVQQAAREIRAKPPPKTGVTVGEWCLRWLEEELKPNVRAVSYAANEGCVRKHLLPSPLGKTPLPDASAEGVRAWIAGVPAGAAVKNRALSVLKRSLSWAVAEGLLAESPAGGVRRVRHRAKETPYIPPGDVWRYLRAVEGDPYEALFVVMATSGLRPSELLALRWKDFDGAALLVDESVSYVGGKHEVEPPKTAAGRRRVPLAREAAVALASRARPDGDALVFPSLGDPSRHYGRHALYHRWEARLREAGLPRVPLYALRHTAVMLYAAAGTDLKTTQVVMGHSDPGTTLKVYTHFVEERATEAARNVDALLGPREAKGDRLSSNGNVKRRNRRR